MNEKQLVKQWNDNINNDNINDGSILICNGENNNGKTEN
jgi:hypothetical protein